MPREVGALDSRLSAAAHVWASPPPRPGPKSLTWGVKLTLAPRLRSSWATLRFS